MRKLLLPLLLCFGSAFSQADSAGLQHALAGLDQLSGDFQQTLLSEAGEALESSSGEFRLLRPAYFAWHILEPEEQLLIASGAVFWHYDVELETVTRRSIDPGNPTSPLAILSGDSDTLENYYEVTQLEDGRWSLEPSFDGAEFAAVELSIENDLPTEMRIRDRVGRTTLILLTAQPPATPLQPADFDFQPPAGVDLYSDEP